MAKGILHRALEAGCSERLHHYLTKDVFGYLLSPNIPVPRSADEKLAIADVGAGTGTFLQDAAKQLPNGTLLVGFDNFVQQAPNRQFSPTMLMEQWDFREQVTPKWHGIFDVVIVRDLACDLKDESVKTFLENVKTMLKPGGVIHWQEANLETSHTTSVSLHGYVQPVATKDFVANVVLPRVRESKWVNQLVLLLQSADFENVDEHSETPRDHLAVALHEFLLDEAYRYAESLQDKAKAARIRELTHDASVEYFSTTDRSISVLTKRFTITAQAPSTGFPRHRVSSLASTYETNIEIKRAKEARRKRKVELREKEDAAEERREKRLRGDPVDTDEETETETEDESEVEGDIEAVSEGEEDYEDEAEVNKKKDNAGKEAQPSNAPRQAADTQMQLSSSFSTAPAMTSGKAPGRPSSKAQATPSGKPRGRPPVTAPAGPSGTAAAGPKLPAVTADDSDSGSQPTMARPCNQCRASKVKCTRTLGGCERCVRRRTACTYID